MPKLVLGGDATRTEWLAARRTGITASEIAVIMGLTPPSWDSPLSLYLRKRGEISENEDNPNEAQALGAYLEDYVCQRFAEQHPDLTLTGNGQDLYAHEEHEWRLATPDRLVWGSQHGERLSVLEAKTSGTRDEWGEGGTDEIPVRYRCQVLWQMHVLGCVHAWVACLFLQGRQVRSYRIQMDAAAEADIELMIKAAEDFRRRIAEDDAPDVDWSDATTHALKQLHPDLADREITIPVRLAGQFRRAKASLKAAEARVKLRENEIRQRLGNGRVVSDPSGNVVATRQVYEVPAGTRWHKAYTVDKLVMRKEEDDGS